MTIYLNLDDLNMPLSELPLKSENKRHHYQRSRDE